jgi:exodeoxyribonuclease VII large subunit
MNFKENALEKNRMLSVRELNLAARLLLEGGLPLLWVRGEISNFVAAASGHWYFSLKDEQAQVRCVMFRHKSQYLDWMPKNGVRVEVLGLATLYEARGDFQLTLEQMRPIGAGALYEAFERLKQKLESEGLFAAAKKRPLPSFPRQIGVITSLQAAALRDVLTTLSRRMPSIPVVVYPVPVQGEGAAQKIAQAVNLANGRAECDVLLLCRGGGSIEDLWAFNEEGVARAIYASHIPLVSGIGHETDFTIADFVADQRAATPTAAAEAVSPERGAFGLRLSHAARRLSQTWLHRLERAMQQLDFLQRRLVHPTLRIAQQGQLLQHLAERLTRAKPDLAQFGARQAELQRRLQVAMRRTLEHQAARITGLQQHIIHLDPEQVLLRGYSMVRDQYGAIVTDSAHLQSGSMLDITLAKGRVQAEVKEIFKGD